MIDGMLGFHPLCFSLSLAALGLTLVELKMKGFNFQEDLRGTYTGASITFLGLSLLLSMSSNHSMGTGTPQGTGAPGVLF